ncbi:hypothetical protein MAR_022426 [Mya arenaria]|uniref:Uncharacterized protein n=1 Tax=Mya arenaria TaxID=6604 RepID=A0ABY7DPN4_MYAAR|nr:hypothetical protein MAR_022426 [Mya arenaria]
MWGKSAIEHYHSCCVCIGIMVLYKLTFLLLFGSLTERLPGNPLPRDKRAACEIPPTSETPKPMLIDKKDFPKNNFRMALKDKCKEFNQFLDEAKKEAQEIVKIENEEERSARCSEWQSACMVDSEVVNNIRVEGLECWSVQAWFCEDAKDTGYVCGQEYVPESVWMFCSDNTFKVGTSGSTSVLPRRDHESSLPRRDDK